MVRLLLPFGWMNSHPPTRSEQNGAPLAQSGAQNFGHRVSGTHRDRHPCTPCLSPAPRQSGSAWMISLLVAST